MNCNEEININQVQYVFEFSPLYSSKQLDECLSSKGSGV